MKKIIFSGLLLFAALSCTNESLKLLYARQETTIENFLNAQLSSNESFYAISNKGSERLVLAKGDGVDSLAAHGTVSFYYAGYVLTGNSLSPANLFSTNHEATAKGAGWTLTGESATQIRTLTLSESDLVEGLKNGLEGVRGGQECIILFSGKYGFGKRPLGTIPANSALAYHIWVESISND